jgi:serine/threonine protein kinase
VKVLGVCVDNDPVYIIMELMPAGDLLKFLRDAKRDHVSFIDNIIIWFLIL